MAATRFRLYRDALRHLADARLAVITDDVESRYALDDAYDQGVEFVLRQAPWRFALKTSPLSGSGDTPLPGFSVSYAKPDDWLYTHALFVLTPDGRERPVDIKEQGNSYYANRDGISVRYISSDFIDPTVFDWPEHFAQAVAAYLAFLVADRVTGEHGAAGRMSQLFSSLLGSATAHDAIPENPWLLWQLEGTFIRTVGVVANQAYWRFALKTALIDTVAGIGEGGLAHSYDVPPDWLFTRELYQLTGDGQHRPFDIRERGRVWHTNADNFYVEYVSADLIGQSELWPEQYEMAVMRALTAERGDAEAKDQAVDFKLGVAALTNAEKGEAIGDNPWLEHQLSGAYARCMPAVIARGWWRFALKTVQMNSELVDQPGGQDTGFDLIYPYRFPLPDDWTQTHALFVNWNGTDCPIDIREQEGLWLTATPVFIARYQTKAVYDARLWPESLAKAVLAYLELDEDEDDEPGEAQSQKPEGKQDMAAVWADAFAAALEEASLPRHPWTRHQLNGNFLQCVRWVLEQARWRFAVKSVELQPNSDPLPGDPIAVNDNDGVITITAPAQHGYANRYIKPGDWLRTLWAGRQINEGLGMTHIDVDYIDEGLTIHCNWEPLHLRYLSVSKGLDPTQWTAHFRDGLLAYCEHIEARGNPKLASLAAEKFKFFQLQLREAERNDDNRDGPLYRDIGRVVRGRYGWGRGYGIGPGYGPAQGWWG